MPSSASSKHLFSRHAPMAGLLFGAWLLPLAALAQAEAPPAIPADDALAEPPPLPPKIQDEQLEPEVVITEEEDRRIEEYRYNGRTYLVRVTPRIGKPYYYMDADGDGQLELQNQDDQLNPVQPALWKIKEW